MPDTGGIDPIQLAQAHHIAFLIHAPDADPPKEKTAASDLKTEILRVDEERIVKAAARSQSGKVLDGIPVTVTITKNDADAITLEDGLLTAVEDGSAEITAASELAGISGKLKVMVTLPIVRVVFSPDDSEYFLAAGEATGEITAMALNKENEPVTPRSNWSWSSDDKGVATVVQSKMQDPNDSKKMVVRGLGQYAKITGAGSGDTEIMATAEGVTGSIDVSVTGQSITRTLRASSSSNGNTFTWNRGNKTNPDDENFTPAFTGRASSGSTMFTVDLYDAISDDRLVLDAITDISIVNSRASDADGYLTVTPTVNSGSIVVTVEAPSGLGGNDGDVDKGTYSTILTISATGANPLKLRFVLVVKDAPEE